IWRRGRDSNPRQGSTLNTLSRRAISTTHPPLRGKLRIVAERERQEIPLEAVEPCDRKKNRLLPPIRCLRDIVQRMDFWFDIGSFLRSPEGAPIILCRGKT